MNYQEKLALVDEGFAALANGQAWEAWQARLADSGLSRLDIKAYGLEVITALDDAYGTSVQEELMASGTATKPANLQESVFEKIVERRIAQVQAILSQRIRQQIEDGGQPQAVIEQNAHPLIDGNVLTAALRDPDDEAEEIQEEDNASPVNLIIGLVLLVGGLGLSMASSGRVLFYGAIMVGLLMVGKYVIAVVAKRFSAP
jgi:hypothetical protein